MFALNLILKVGQERCTSVMERLLAVLFLRKKIFQMKWNGHSSLDMDLLMWYKLKTCFALKYFSWLPIFEETIELFTMFNHYITYILCHLLHMKQIALFNMLMVYCVMSNRQSAVLSGCGIKAAIMLKELWESKGISFAQIVISFLKIPKMRLMYSLFNGHRSNCYSL